MKVKKLEWLPSLIHDLSNTLGGIKVDIFKIQEGRIELLKEDTLIEGAIANINTQVNQSLELVANLRKAVIRNHEIEPIDLASIIALVFKRVQIPDNIKVSVNTDGDMPKAIGTPQLIEVINNLVTNAIESMPNGGELKLEAGLSERDKQLQLIISDTGSGLPENVRKLIFRKFITTKNGRQGFGLWWSKVYLEQLGGDIEFETILDQGSNFTLFIPSYENEIITTVSDEPIGN